MAISEEKRKVIYGSLAGIALVATVLVFVFKGERDDIPNTVGSKSPWMCSSCRHTVELTPKELSDLQDKQGSEWKLPPEGRYVTSTRSMAMACPACGAMALRQAARCQGCDAIYLPTEQSRPGPFCELCAQKGLKPRSDADLPPD